MHPPIHVAMSTIRPASRDLYACFAFRSAFSHFAFSIAHCMCGVVFCAAFCGHLRGILVLGED